MAPGRFSRTRVAALVLACAGVGLVGGGAVRAQTAVGAYAESPADALSRNMKILAGSPRNFDALIAAGRASLALADTQSAAGFFGRADEVWPASPLPQAGMGAALAQDGDGATALQFFARATQRGATQSMIGADRGLAYDLLGQHTQAQADYKAALLGRDGDEARRRLALSLAITGNKAEALSTLGPLMAKGDAAGARTRAFVLALTGDVAGARTAINAAMPGSASSMEYFFRKLPTLRSDEKVAACNLGIFPGNGVQVASALPVIAPGATATVSSNADGDRLGSIEQWLSGSAPSAAAQPAPQPSVASPSQQAASVSLPTKQAVQTATSANGSTATYASSKVWLQLSSGASSAALPAEFRKMKRRNRDLFDGITGYVFEDGSRARLLIGPFRNARDAEIFAQDLETVQIDAFAWTSQPGQTLTKLSSE